jgi:hypothetical protein
MPDVTWTRYGVTGLQNKRWVFNLLGHTYPCNLRVTSQQHFISHFITNMDQGIDRSNLKKVLEHFPGANPGHGQYMSNLLYCRSPTSSMRIHLSLLPSTAQKDTHGLPPTKLHLLRPLRLRAQIHPQILLKRVKRRLKHRQTWLINLLFILLP